MRNKLQKKAAIELSVTAIVILILAIVILGLGLGFIRGMFTKVATQFEEQIAAEPEPNEPSSAEPITLSRETLIVHSGDPVALKVGIHNPSSDKWEKTNFNITCDEAIITETQFNKKDLASGESFTGTFLFVVGEVGEGIYLCEAKSRYGDPSQDTNYTKDMTIRVSR